jgi:ribosomal protein S18 acetylase RimI-like enzyme
MGIGLAMMYYLHAVAALRGSEKVRLRVHRKNIQAQSLYQKMGYRFQDDSKGQEYLLGYAELSRHLQTRGI